MEQQRKGLKGTMCDTTGEVHQSGLFHLPTHSFASCSHFVCRHAYPSKDSTTEGREASASLWKDGNWQLKIVNVSGDIGAGRPTPNSRTSAISSEVLNPHLVRMMCFSISGTHPFLTRTLENWWKGHRSKELNSSCGRCGSQSPTFSAKLMTWGSASGATSFQTWFP